MIVRSPEMTENIYAAIPNYIYAIRKLAWQKQLQFLPIEKFTPFDGYSAKIRFFFDRRKLTF